MWLLRHPQTLGLATKHRDLPKDETLRRLATLVLRDLRVAGLEHLPASGPALVVAPPRPGSPTASC